MTLVAPGTGETVVQWVPPSALVRMSPALKAKTFGQLAGPMAKAVAMPDGRLLNACQVWPWSVLTVKLVEELVLALVTGNLKEAVEPATMRFPAGSTAAAEGAVPRMLPSVVAEWSPQETEVPRSAASESIT